MGVHGLWQLLQASGRPVSLESLDGKILAVDVSLWLHQTTKGMRDKDGNPLPNAHLHGLFTRICKLLFYRIKPVFVFDGGVPILKKQTLAARRERKEFAEKESGKASRKLLENLMKSHAVKAALGQDTSGVQPGPSSLNSNRKPDVFELAPLPDIDRGSTDAMNYDDEFEEELLEYQALMEEKFQSLNNIDTESDDFKNLPPEIRHEILTEMKEVRKKHFVICEDLPEDTDDFSSFQISKLMKRSKLSSQIEDVRKQMNARNSGDITASLGWDIHSDNVITSRVVSEDSSHYILIKGLGKKRQLEEANECEKIVAEMEKMEPKVKSVKKCYEDSSNGEISSDLDELGLNSEEERLREIYKRNLERTMMNDSHLDDDVVISSKAFKKGQSSQHIERVGVSSSKTGMEQKTDTLQTNATTENNEDSSDDEGFIEVTIDPNKADQDDMFPAAMFDSADVKKDFIAELIKLKNKKMQTKSSETLIQSDESKVETYSSCDKNNTRLLEKPNNHDMQEKTNQVQAEIPLESSDFKKPKDPINELHTNTNIKENNFSSREVTKDLVLTSDGDGSSKIELEQEITNQLSDRKETDFNKQIEVIDVECENISNKEIEFNKKEFELLTDDEKGIINNKLKGFQDVKDIDIESEEFKSLPPEIQVELFTAKNNQPNVTTDEQLSTLVDEANAEDLHSDHGDDGGQVVIDEERRNFGEEFHGLNRGGLEDMQTELEFESQVLRQEIGKQDRLATSITDQMNLEAQELLQLFGIPYVVSTMEAEAQCAFLDVNQLTHGSITDDSDVWLFGGQRVYKNFFNQNRHVELYTKAMIDSHFGLSREALINIALLCGSDYTEGIQGIGPVTALEILAEFSGERLEGLKKLGDWWRNAQKEKNKPPESKLKYKLQKLHFNPGFPSEVVVEAYLKPTVDESLDKFSWGTPDLDLLRDFGKSKLGWSKEKVDELIKPLLKQLAQTHVSFFYTDICYFQIII
ncbi:DNA excision repair protein ERCC-5 [Patella vulgata]|uniref:DNA excision repair protein ERCC-5 n=1 Tax=Patella vulgata TaxID=6465 RepID=UPI00218098FB|nr:DNA excision repair protein ERCC-5 [Patella vulgata]